MTTKTKYTYSLMAAHLQANFPEARIERTGEYSAWVFIDQAYLSMFVRHCFFRDVDIDLGELHNYNTGTVDFEITWI